MDEVHKIVLSRCQESIMRELDYNMVCANLILTGAISWKLHHIIDARPTNRLKARALLAVLARRGPMAFQKLMSAIDKADYVCLVKEVNRVLYDVYMNS